METLFHSQALPAHERFGSIRDVARASHAPHHIHTESPTAFPARLRVRDLSVARRGLPGRTDIGALLAPVLTRLPWHPTRYGLGDTAHLSRAVLDLATALVAHHAGACGPADGSGSGRRVLFVRVQSFIRVLLCDPALSSDLAVPHAVTGGTR